MSKREWHLFQKHFFVTKSIFHFNLKFLRFDLNFIFIKAITYLQQDLPYATLIVLKNVQHY